MAAELAEEIQIASFRIGGFYLGIDIRCVQEINRHVQATKVPHAPACVRGVINLRGEVVTVIDPAVILGLPPITFRRNTRNIIVCSGGEHVGLLVDAIEDVVTTTTDRLEPPPSSLGTVDVQILKSVLPMGSELLVVVDIDRLLCIEEIV